MADRDIVARSGRVELARFTLRDLDAVHAFASDPWTTRYMTWGPNSRADTHRFLALAVTPSPDRLDLAVLADGALIGSSAVWTTSTEHRTGEIGYVLHADHWGRGIGTTTARLLIGLGVDRLGLRRVSATCDTANIASARVLEKAGMTREGLHRGYRLVAGQARDHYSYGCLPGRRV